MARDPVERFMDAIETTAACFLAFVTALTFVSVFLRYFFAWQIPDSYDIGSLLLGVLIFWGIAGASYRGEHIRVDVLWSLAPAALKRAIDLFADLVTLACLVVFTWMTGSKVLTTRADNVLTFDLRLPVWLFYGLAFTGLAAAILLLAIRTLRLLAGRAARADDAAPRSLE